MGDLSREGREWLEKNSRINLRLNEKKLAQLEELAQRYGLAIEDARTCKVIWRLLDDSYNINREKDKIKEKIRQDMDDAGIEKFEL